MDILTILYHLRMCVESIGISQSPLALLPFAGLFFGDEAISAMAKVHIYEGRRWLGWYNSPGSYHVAKRLRLLSRSRCHEHSFSGIHTDATKLFESDVSSGPKFIATQSGVVIKKTCHTAALLVKECATREGKVVEGRKSQTVEVTIATLSSSPSPFMHFRCINPYTPILAIIPISVSAAACIVCGVSGDWFSFSSILVGILASGISSLIIGSARLVFTHPDPLKGSPPGDGILMGDREIVLLKGTEDVVNAVTRGTLWLNFATERQYRCIELCSILLHFQFFAQMLLVARGSTFGRYAFASSFVVSWIYNSWLSFLDLEKVQRDILLHSVLGNPVLSKYIFGTRTSAVVFTLLVLHPKEPSQVLDKLIPNDTKVWREWKDTILQRLHRREQLSFVANDWKLETFTNRELLLLETLYYDAQAAYHCYLQYVAHECFLT